jgi:CHASE1-domain containing sensor protein
MDDSIKQSILTSKAVIVLVLLFGLVASILGWRITQSRIDQLEQARFAQQADTMVGALRLRVHSLSLGLRGARAVPLLTNGELLPHHFRRY